RLLLADDHAIVRRGLKEVLRDGFPGAVFGEAGNVAETLEQVSKNKWDIVILDITMPGRSGLEALADLRRERPKMPVLMLSTHREDQYAVRSLKAGAAGYITKDKAPEQLVVAVRT